MLPGDEPPAADDRALEQQLRDRKFGPPQPFEVTPWDFARRWGDTVLRERVWPIVSRLLVDDDELVRERALELVAQWTAGAELTTPRLIEVAERHLDLYGEQKPEGVALRHSLAQALSNVASVQRAQAQRGRIVAVLRKIATAAPLGATVLGEHDPAFVAERAVKWGDPEAKWIEDAAGAVALYRRDSIIPFLSVLRVLSEATRARVLAVVERNIQRDDAAATALARSEELPHPIAPAPSPEECRRAIGFAT